MEIKEWGFGPLSLQRYRLIDRARGGALTYWFVGVWGFGVGIHVPARAANWLTRRSKHHGGRSGDAVDTGGGG